MCVGGCELVVGGVFGFYLDSLSRKSPGSGMRRLGLKSQSCWDPAVSLGQVLDLSVNRNSNSACLKYSTVML